MHTCKLFLSAFLLVSAIACSTSTKDTPYQVNNDGVTVNLLASDSSLAKHIRLQVVNDNIIHVSATPADSFSSEASLIATEEPTTVPWTTHKIDHEVVLQTATLKAYVSLKTGEIRYTDLNDKTILQEEHGGSKYFNPIEVDGYKGYSITQRFLSPDNEAFYGLGQHQSGDLNYKGKNEELYQYNTKVSVPFIVSNKNYGILWDNYSLTRFGDPRPYGELNEFTLYNSKGDKGALTATYLEDNNPKKLFVERNESKIDYENIESVKQFPQGFPFNNSGIIWKGELEAKQSGNYKFKLYYAGYTKVFIDDSLVVAERWRTAWNPNTFKFNYNFEAGARHKIRIEWKPDGGVSYLSLKVLSPVNPQRQNELSLWSEMGKELNYYFIKGNNLDQVVSGYRTVTGKAQVMPKWSMGYWQSRERYKTQDELLNVLKEYRKENIPIDNIVQDWFYWPETKWGSHDFDTTRFPNAQKMVEEVHQLNGHIMISVWPKFYASTKNYKDFDSQGWMFQRATKDSIRDWIHNGYVGSFYDAYSPEARALFWKQMQEKLYCKGFDAWWMDASEPDIQSNASMKYRKELMNPTVLGSSTEYFNAYGLMNAKGIYEGQRSTKDNKRVFLLTRSGFAGSQKYAAVIWSGDIATRWEDMASQITAGLNFSISGNPYWTMDDGGFCVEKRYEKAKEGSEDLKEWRELNVRWHQFGAFVPLFRSHGQFPYREIWNISPKGTPIYNIMVYYNKLRYRLMPYIYSLAGMAYWNDYTLMRPLVMNYPNDTHVLNIKDQYCFGPNLMVCPVCKYKARERSIYFPAGTSWYNVYTGACIQGAQTKIESSPLEHIPLYAPAGAILPVGDIIQSTNEAQKNLTLYVYAGKDGDFTLYEDENTNYNYEKGSCTHIHFTYNDANKTLTISNREGSFNGMIQNRKISIVYITPEHPCSIDSKEPQVQISISVNYNGQKQTLQL